jgi:hypothetical protein
MYNEEPVFHSTRMGGHQKAITILALFVVKFEL